VLGKADVVPGWPGPEVHPPQPMVDQLRGLFDRCAHAHAGADVTVELFEGSGHAPFIDAQERWQATFFDFLVRAGA
jgi:hypothetical protein